MHVEIQNEHKWLQKLVGDWTFEGECSMGPGQPTSKYTGTETVRSLGGLWSVCEGQGEMPGGGTMTSIMTLGFDPSKQRFVGTFIATMMTHLWIYDGALDPTGTMLILEAEGPSFTDPGKSVNYRDVIEFKSDDHRVLTSQVPGENGEWQVFMTANYRRVK